jgi:hypothetical protein
MRAATRCDAEDLRELPKLRTRARFPSSALLRCRETSRTPEPALRYALGIAGGGVDDAHVEVFDEANDVGLREVTADARLTAVEALLPRRNPLLNPHQPGPANPLGNRQGGRLGASSIGVDHRPRVSERSRLA